MSERQAVTDAALDPDAARTNEADGTAWFVAYTNPRREHAAADGVRRRSFGAFVPVMTVSRTQSRRRVEVSSPLLPRYLFVGLAPDQTLYGLRETPGLEGLVRMAGEPVRVKPAIITGLREAQAAGVYDFSDAAQDRRDAVKRSEAARAFAPGLKVRILSGPFASFSGIVEEHLPDERISVVVNIFGRGSPVPMMLADIELA